MSNPERFQGDPNPEYWEISDDKLIEILKQGAEKPEAQEMLQRWCEQEEKKIEAIDEKEPAIRFNIRRGLIYAQAGYAEEGLDSLDGALTQALHENLVELYEEIETEIEKIKDIGK